MYRWKGRVSPIEANLGYWLHYVGYRIGHQLCLRTQKFGVTAAEWVVLRALYEQGAMPSHVALRLGVTRGAISKLAARLEAKDMIHRVKSLPDRRAKLMTLTQLGRVLVPVLAPMADENDTRYFGRMAQALCQIIEWVLKSIVRRDRWRFVPVGQCCIIPPHRYGEAQGYG